MFKNVIVYRIDQWERPAVAELETRLDAARFVECGASQSESLGWVEPRGEKHGPLIESVAGQWILKLCTETKAVPGGAVKSQLEARLVDLITDTAVRVRDDAALQRRIEEAVEATVDRTMTRFGADVDALVTGTIASWDAEQTADQLELLLGPDLQYIRINGAVVGALAGLSIYTVAQAIG